MKGGYQFFNSQPLSGGAFFLALSAGGVLLSLVLG